jgi:hypothetical protein
MQKQEVAVPRRFLVFAIAIISLAAAGCSDSTNDDRREAPQYQDEASDEADSYPWNPGVGIIDVDATAQGPDGPILNPDLPGVVKDGQWIAQRPDAGYFPEDEADVEPTPDAGGEDDATNEPEPDAPEPDAGTQPTPDATPDAGTQPTPSNPTAFLNRIDTRAMWVWSESPSAREILENTGGAQDALLNFAAAPHGQPARALNRLFFEARAHSNVDRFAQLRPIAYDPLTVPSAQADLRAFLRRAHAQGIAVEYLDGQAIWVTTDANARRPRQICADVVAFNLGSADLAERFDGVHFDIEPHTIRSGPWAGQWWQNRLPGGYNAEWTQRWMDIMTDCRQTFDAYEARTGHHLTLAGDVGADYAFYNAPILAFFNGPNSPVDYVGIMNYYDDRANQNGRPSFFYGDFDGSNLVGGVEQNLALWTNVPLLFGIETGPPSIAPDAASFYQEGYGALNQTVDSLVAGYAHTGAIGVAIHHYSPQSYRDLQP